MGSKCSRPFKINFPLIRGLSACDQARNASAMALPSTLPTGGGEA